jgi:hypothetical protein
MFARARFGWSMGEVSGSLGDLGTFLPHIVGAITVVRMGPTGILTTTLGLFYALSGAFYGVPMAVQPMKAASAAVLIEPMNLGAIAGAGLAMGAFFLLIGMTGIVSWVARALLPTIAAGLQLGLGCRSARSAFSEIASWPLTPENLRLIRSLTQREELLRLRGPSTDLRLLFRHDRVRDWLFVEAGASMDAENRLADEIVAEPFFAEVLGAVIVRQRANLPVAEYPNQCISYLEERRKPLKNGTRM